MERLTRLASIPDIALPAFIAVFALFSANGATPDYSIKRTAASSPKVQFRPTHRALSSD